GRGYAPAGPIHNRPTPSAPKPLIGFADPLFNKNQQPPVRRVATNVTVTKAVRGGVADVLNLVTALDPLPETADELQRVAASVEATEADIILGPKATETRVKQTRLEDYRIIYFATHGLLAGEVAQLAKLNAEPHLFSLCRIIRPRSMMGFSRRARPPNSSSMPIGWCSRPATRRPGTGPVRRLCRDSPAHFSMPGGDRFWCRTGKPRSIALPTS